MQEFFRAPLPILIAHRGVPPLAFENTMDSFEKAVEEGAEYIELDVQMTRDRRLVVFHDNDVDRVTQASGLLRHFSLEEVRRMRIGGGVHPIPTLSEVLEQFHGRVQLIVELKKVPEAVPHLLQLLNQHNMIQEVLLCTFDTRVIQIVREESKHISLGWLRWIVSERDLAFATRYQLQAIHANDVYLTKKIVKNIHKNGQKVLAWTPGFGPMIRRAIKLNVDGIITNHIAKAQRIRDEYLAVQSSMQDVS